MFRRVRQGSILYVTVDGVLQQLGYSQVGRVILGLAERGFKYQLLSLESAADLAQRSHVRELEERFANAGIRWTPLPYDGRGTALAAASNLTRLARTLGRLTRGGAVKLVHARGYHSALVALGVQRTLGVPYLFDARGRWIDERLLGGRWFTNPRVERAARAVERRLYDNADGLVVLTQLHGDDIVDGAFGRYRGTPLQVVTTCADFSAFRLEHRDAPAPSIPSAIQARLAGKLVVGFVGSTNAFYRHAESFQLAQRILNRRPDSHLLILSAQEREFTELVRQHALPADRVSITRARHEAMPEWLSRIHWAIQLLNTGVAKRGSMPTKLAEFLAAGVRPIHFGCNEEVTGWVERTGSGLVLAALDAAALDAAAQFVADSSSDRALLERARERARPHFDLAAGLDTYAALLSQLNV